MRRFLLLLRLRPGLRMRRRVLFLYLGPNCFRVYGLGMSDGL